MATTQTILLLFGIISAVLANAPCVDFSDVCVPAQSMETGCRCALIRPGQQASAAITLHHLIALHNRTKRDTFDEIRFSILQQSGVDELNRFFPTAESEPVGVDNNVFASINTQVHSSLMTVSRALVGTVLDMLGDWLTPEARNVLLNCGLPRCEIVGQITDLIGDGNPARPDRKFAVARAVRYDVDGEDTTVIAYTSSVSEFVLNLQLVQWEEEHCKRTWYGKKSCWQETKSREDPRVFDDATRDNWMNHVNREMVGMFRMDNANMLV